MGDIQSCNIIVSLQHIFVLFWRCCVTDRSYGSAVQMGTDVIFEYMALLSFKLSRYSVFKLFIFSSCQNLKRKVYTNDKKFTETHIIVRLFRLFLLFLFLGFWNGKNKYFTSLKMWQKEDIKREREKKKSRNSLKVYSLFSKNCWITVVATQMNYLPL